MTRQLQLHHFDETPIEEERQAYFAKASQIVVIELILVFLVLFSGTIATLLGWASYQKFSPILNMIFFSFIYLFGL